MVIRSNIAWGWFRFLVKKLSSVSCSFKDIQIIALLVISCSILSVIIPPFQSPDEFDHIKRAYLLGKGVLVLNHPEGQSSGGYIDSGLQKFMDSYGVIKGKLSAKEIYSANKIEWSGNRVYSPAPGTGYYFPAIYLPQALGLEVGELFNLTIDHSYRLARAFSLAAIALLLYLAFRLYPPNPLTLALIAIPMTLFQFSSASLDGVSTALAVFSISAFLHIATNRKSSFTWVQFAFALSIALLASSRIHALPMLILLAATFFYTKQLKSLILFFLTTIFVFAWTIFAIKSTIDLRVSIGNSTSSIILYYLQNPAQFFVVIWHTLSNEDLRRFYLNSFIGVLGWLDSTFHDWYYKFFLLLISIIAILSFSLKNIIHEWPERLLLLSVSVISVLFIFFALLVTWSPYPAQLISGVQGRYFLIPCIVLSYSFSGKMDLSDGFRRKLTTFIVFFLFMFSLLATVHLLISRYYLVESNADTKVIIFGSDVLGGSLKMVPSAPLTFKSPIVLNFPSFEENGLGKINRIGILFGTYARTNLGEAELTLNTKSGLTYSQKIPLSELVDNAYQYFSVPADYYTSGKLKFFSGGNVSIWEINLGNNEALSCLNFDTILNQKVVIHGCP